MSVTPSSDSRLSSCPGSGTGSVLPHGVTLACNFYKGVPGIKTKRIKWRLLPIPRSTVYSAYPGPKGISPVTWSISVGLAKVRVWP